MTEDMKEEGCSPIHLRPPLATLWMLPIVWLAATSACIGFWLSGCPTGTAVWGTLILLLVVALVSIFAWWGSRIAYTISSRGVERTTLFGHKAIPWNDVTVFCLRNTPSGWLGTTVIAQVNKCKIALKSGQSPIPASEAWSQIRNLAATTFEDRLTNLFREGGTLNIRNRWRPVFIASLILLAILIAGILVQLSKKHFVDFGGVLFCFVFAVAIIFLNVAHFRHGFSEIRAGLQTLNVRNMAKFREYRWDAIDRVVIVQAEGNPLPPSPEISIHLPDTKKPLRITPGMRNYTLFVMLLKRLGKIAN